MTSTIFIVNGPNLNLLGKREPEIYGTTSLADVEALSRTRADNLGLAIDFRQTNSEGTLIDWIHEARENAAGVIVNAGGYSHTSIALMDALLALNVPLIEVHLSNIHRREDFRHHSYMSRVAAGVIVGLGAFGYEMALEAIARLIKRPA